MASSSSPNLRENKFLKAQLAAEAGRHGHAFRFMMELAQSITPWTPLYPSERKFLLSSLKNYLEDNIKAWYRTNCNTNRWEDAHFALARSYAWRLTDEVLSVCRLIKPWIARWLALTPEYAVEAKVFYLTFNADVCSYFAELVEDKGNEDVEVAITAYKDGREFAKKELPWLNPVRLMLELHTSQFYSDVLEQPEKGVKIADEALTQATEAGKELPALLTEEVNELLSKLRDHIATNKEEEDEEEGTLTSQAQLVAGTPLMTQVAFTSETGAKAEISMDLRNETEASGNLTQGLMEELNELVSKVSDDFTAWRNYEQENAAAQLVAETFLAIQVASPSETGAKAEISMDLKNAIEASAPPPDGGLMEEIDDMFSKFIDDFDTSRKYEQEKSEAGTSQLVPGTSLMTEVASPSETVEKAETSGTSETSVTPPTESGESPPMASPPPPSL